MIHAGEFTILVLGLLNRTICLDSGCLNGDSVSNVSNQVSDGEDCPEALNYTVQYCQCYYPTMNKIHHIIEAARNSSISFANTEDLLDFEQTVEEMRKVVSSTTEILGNITNCTKTQHPCLSLYEQRKNRKQNYTDTYHKLQDLLDMARTTHDIVYYYMPPLITLVFLCGMMGNITLLYIFYKHPDSRSGSKILLVNLAVSDVLLLLFNFFAKYYFTLFSFKLGPAVCHIYTFLVITAPRVSILSMVVLSITRYIAVTAMPGDRSHKLLDHMPVAVTLVWIAASLEAIRATLEAAIIKYDFSDKTHCDIRTSVTTASLVCTFACFLPFCIICFFSLATYRKLRGSVQKTSAKSALDMAKERNAKILPALTLCFIITYPPYYLLYLTATIHKYALSSAIIWYYYTAQFLLNINSALNPLVLYLSSGMFREYFDKYLRTGCKKVQEQEQNKPERSSDGTTTTPMNNESVITYAKVYIY